MKDNLKTSKHTPGPWKATADPYSEVVIDASGRELCVMVGSGPQEANARLIAAAPDLLEALRDLVNVITGRMDGETVALQNALAAIAKAEAAA